MDEPSASNRTTRASSRPGLLVVLLVVAAFGVWQWWNLERPEAERQPPPASADAPTTATPPPTAAPSSTHPSRDLSLDEKRGGHTLARHVGLTDAALRDRLARERGISAASTYTNRSIAEATVGRVLAEQSRRIEAWTARQGTRPNLALSFHGPADEIIGRTLPRSRREPIPSTDAVVVLRWDGRGFFVLTSYPEVRR